LAVDDVSLRIPRARLLPARTVRLRQDPTLRMIDGHEAVTVGDVLTAGT
jgi:hypothetical protein